MVTTKKKTVGETGRSLWDSELVSTSKFSDYIEDIENTEKIIIFGESNSGKTTFYLSIVQNAKQRGIKPKDFMMCIVFPDRPTGLTKLFRMIPEDFRDRIYIYPIDKYEELVSATAQAEKKLMEHHKLTGKHGWLVNELLEEDWKMSQDYYSRQAYGENLGDYFATKVEVIKQMMADKGKSGKESAYQAFTGFTDWTTIKYFHNFNWIDRIKRMPFNVLFTAEVKGEESKESIFYELGLRPAGEKDNMHRVDTILHLSHKSNDFTIQPFKLTGYTKLYPKTKITGKNGYSVHRYRIEELEKQGLRSSAFAEYEEDAGITPPKKPSKPKKEKPKKEKEVEEESDSDDDFDLDL